MSFVTYTACRYIRAWVRPALCEQPDVTREPRQPTVLITPSCMRSREPGILSPISDRNSRSDGSVASGDSQS
ncbi:uncharacterized protein B0H18DRAFT_313571 [Fomitopsis serialis]|uniref:uncharacterized protein n=1 Tax=Fomitopsis serialis TaxID=139415 RepID=UPI002007747D|nr:uncharacterized protein B0H18DRAFT_313571 [Neoantrodia serialis]KAH9936138.1 hypothetical protein B0H18DRAFT_313571 [Neoantrodia serialis]